MVRHMEDNILTPEEAAEMLGVKLMTLYQWVYRKKIKCFRIGDGQYRMRFRRREVEKYIEKRRAREESEAKAKAEKERVGSWKKSGRKAKQIDLDAAVRESLEPKKDD